MSQYIRHSSPERPDNRAMVRDGDEEQASASRAWTVNSDEEAEILASQAALRSSYQYPGEPHQPHTSRSYNRNMAQYSDEEEVSASRAWTVNSDEEAEILASQAALRSSYQHPREPHQHSRYSNRDMAQDSDEEQATTSRAWTADTDDELEIRFSQAAPRSSCHLPRAPSPPQLSRAPREYFRSNTYAAPTGTYYYPPRGSDFSYRSTSPSFKEWLQFARDGPLYSLEDATRVVRDWDVDEVLYEELRSAYDVSINAQDRPGRDGNTVYREAVYSDDAPPAAEREYLGSARTSRWVDGVGESVMSDPNEAYSSGSRSRRRRNEHRRH